MRKAVAVTAVMARTTTIPTARAQMLAGGSCRYRGRCFDCGERGHMARNYPQKKKEKALLADVEEEYALL